MFLCTVASKKTSLNTFNREVEQSTHRDLGDRY